MTNRFGVEFFEVDVSDFVDGFDVEVFVKRGVGNVPGGGAEVIKHRLTNRNV